MIRYYIQTDFDDIYAYEVELEAVENESGTILWYKIINQTLLWRPEYSMPLADYYLYPTATFFDTIEETIIYYVGIANDMQQDLVSKLNILLKSISKAKKEVADHD